MGETISDAVGPPDWTLEPLQRFAYIDETTDGFTELRVHGVSGPPPDQVLDYPAAAVSLIQGNATSGFWRRWRLGGSLEDIPDQHRIEAFSWGGLTSGAARQALWLPLLPFSLVNLAHWMLPPYAPGRPGKCVSYAAVSLLRVLGLSFTVTLALAGAEVTMDLCAWQCGANPGCLATLQRHDPLGRFLGDPGPRVAIGGGLLFLVLLLLLLAGNARFQPLRDSDPMASPVVPLTDEAEPAQPVLGDAKFWAVDHSTRWLRCLHTVAWCAATGAVATAALAAVRAKGDHHPVGCWLTVANLAVLAGAFALGFCQRFGRGGKAWRGTSGYRWINLAAVCLLVASLTVTAVYMPTTPTGSHPALPYVQGALGWLTFGQAVTLAALLGCVGWLAWRLPRVGNTGSRPWGPLLGGMLALVTAQLGWLLGLSQSAGYGRWVGDRLRGGSAPGSGFTAALPNFYTWVDAYAVVAIVITLLWAGYLACRVVNRTGETTASVLADQPAEPASVSRSTPAEMRSRAKSAARWRILAQSVETVPSLLAAVAFASFLLIVGWCCHFADPGWIAALASVGAWVITAGTAGLVVAAYAAFRNPSTRRIVGILWDITTFWPRANHPLTPACSAQRAVPQLADRIAVLTTAENSDLVLSAHSQGSVLAAAAVLRLAHAEGRRPSLERLSLLTYGSPLRRLYARGFPAYFSVSVLEQVSRDTGRRWRNLWAQTDPIGADIALPSASAAGIDWQMRPDPLTLDIDPRTGERVKVCDHSGYLSRPEYPFAVECLRRLPIGETHRLMCRNGRMPDGSCDYVLRMTDGQLPGEDGAWSVTLYDQLDGLVRNDLMRFSLGSASDQLAITADGAIDIYLQASAPSAARRTNWLPTPPKAPFNVVLRVYWPSAGRPPEWEPPRLDVAP